MERQESDEAADKKRRRLDGESSAAETKAQEVNVPVVPPVDKTCK